MDGDLLCRQVGMGIDFVCSAMLGIVYLLLRIRRPAHVEVSPNITKAQRTENEKRYTDSSLVSY
jgi:hypothetical protein